MLPCPSPTKPSSRAGMATRWLTSSTLSYHTWSPHQRQLLPYGPTRECTAASPSQCCQPLVAQRTSDLRRQRCRAGGGVQGCYGQTRHRAPHCDLTSHVAFYGTGCRVGKAGQYSGCPMCVAVGVGVGVGRRAGAKLGVGVVKRDGSELRVKRYVWNATCETLRQTHSEGIGRPRNPALSRAPHLCGVVQGVLRPSEPRC